MTKQAGRSLQNWAMTDILVAYSRDVSGPILRTPGTLTLCRFLYLGCLLEIFLGIVYLRRFIRFDIRAFSAFVPIVCKYSSKFEISKKQQYYDDGLEVVPNADRLQVTPYPGLEVAPYSGLGSISGARTGKNYAEYSDVPNKPPSEWKRKRFGHPLKFWGLVISIGILILIGVVVGVAVGVTSHKHGSSVPSSTPTQSSAPAQTSDVILKIVGSPVDMIPGGDGTYPRANLLANGNLIGTYTSFPNGTNVINVIQSTDGGNSWQQLGTVTRGPSNASDIDNPYILELPSGRLLVAFRNHLKNSTTGAYTHYRITICFSDDAGASWLFLSEPAADPAGPNGNWEPFLRNTRDGNLQLYYSRTNSAADQDTLMRTSTDGGMSWSTTSTITGSGVESRDGMVGVATISGTDLIAVFESTDQHGLFGILYVTSPDDGSTWGNRSKLYTPTATGVNNAGSPQIITVGNTLVCSFMTDEDTSHDWYLGADTKIIVSTNRGSTWNVSTKTTVFGVQANWPGMVALSSTSFLVMADHDGSKSQTLTLA